MSKVSSAAGRLAIIGNYRPRRCGIATFTTHLCEAIVAHEGEGACFAVPVNDRRGGYAYPGRVRFELTERDLTSYQRAADFLNISNVDVPNVVFSCGAVSEPDGSVKRYWGGADSSNVRSICACSIRSGSRRNRPET